MYNKLIHMLNKSLVIFQYFLKNIRSKSLFKSFLKILYILLGSKDLELNIQNHYCIVLANQEQNMSRLGVQAMLK